MISTITTSTVTTVTTFALTGSVVLIGIVFLFMMLVQKEVATVSEDNRLSKLGKALNIAIIPLLFAFAVLAITRIVEVLR